MQQFFHMTIVFLPKGNTDFIEGKSVTGLIFLLYDVVANSQQIV